MNVNEIPMRQWAEHLARGTDEFHGIKLHRFSQFNVVTEEEEEEKNNKKKEDVKNFVTCSRREKISTKL
jgi:hypothetical protein